MIERVSAIVYRNMIRECRKYMRGLKPSDWLWRSNAMSIHHYIQQLRYLQNHIKDEHNEWQKINPKEA